MASSDEDEDLKRAIELSLQDHNSEPKRENQQAANVACSNGEVIDLDSDEDAKCAAKSRKASPSPLASSNSSYICNNFLGLNRKAMEQERLARKRKTPISPPPLRKSVKLDIGGSPLNVPVALMTNDSARLLALPKMKVERKCAQPNFMPTTSSAPMYLDGAVKKTWARGYDRSEDVKMEELLQREDLTLAVISSFQWEIDWLFSKLDTKSTQLTLIMHAKEESTRRQYQEETSAMRNLRLCFPPMEGNVQCMHSKFMLLGHSSFLRMVITTANMTPHDWGETSVMENMVFVIDLPKLPADHERLTIDQMTFFGKELLYFFEAMGLDGKIIQSILRFDFSRTKDLAFVHSIGGVHAGEKDPWRRTGYCGLGTAIRELGLMSERDITIDYVTSSMGSLNIEFLTKLYVAAQGDDGLAEYDVRYAAAKVKQNKGDETQQAQFKALETVRKTARDNFRVYFPTQETVLASNGGVAAGGTICFNRKCFDYPEFPRGVLRDCWSRRTGLLMHNKVSYLFRLLPSVPIAARFYN